MLRQLLIQKRWLVLLSVFLSACQHIQRESDNAEWLSDDTIFVQRQVDFEQQAMWQYSAKMGIVTENINEQANIVWSFSNQLNDVRLFGPFGAGQVQLEFDEYGVRLSDKDGVVHQGYAANGDTAEKLLSEIAGLPIPLDALSYWMFVLPKPGTVFEYQLDEQDDLTVLKQLGWLIQYSDYRDYGGNLLPRKLTATRTRLGVTTQRVTVKLVTKDWQW